MCTNWRHGPGSDSTTTSTSTGTTTTETTATETSASACGVDGDPCTPCCAGYICIGQADKSEICCEIGDDRCYCVCENHDELEAVPEACTGLDLPPFAGDTEVAGWLAEPDIIRATSHEPYYCSPTGPRGRVCPCAGFLEFFEVELPSPSYELGEVMVISTSTVASCRDLCDVETNSQDRPFEIIAVTETCIVGETTGGGAFRVYVDRNAC